MRIAVLNANPEEAKTICRGLHHRGHACVALQYNPVSRYGQETALRHLPPTLMRESYDLLIVDGHIPRSKLSWRDILHCLRDKFPFPIPILWITRYPDQVDVVSCLTAGADDYMIQPVCHDELVARANALLRRAYPAKHSAPQLIFNDYLFEARSGCLTRKGQRIDTTQKEFELALLFFKNLGRSLSRAYILEAVWSRHIEIPSRTMDTHVSRLRKKLQLIPDNGFQLSPVYNYGYRLERLDVST